MGNESEGKDSGTLAEVGATGRSRDRSREIKLSTLLPPSNNNTYGVKSVSDKAYKQMQEDTPGCIALIDECQKNASKCTEAQGTCNGELLAPYQESGLNTYDVRKKCEIPGLCYNFSAPTTWLNLNSTRKALGVTSASAKWASCNYVVNAQFSADWMAAQQCEFGFQGRSDRDDHLKLTTLRRDQQQTRSPRSSPPVSTSSSTLATPTLSATGSATRRGPLVRVISWFIVSDGSSDSFSLPLSLPLSHPISLPPSFFPPPLSSLSKALDWPGKAAFDAAPDHDWKCYGLKAGTARTASGPSKGSGKLTFLQVNNAGHMVPMDVPREALAMVDQFLSGKAF